MEDRSLRYFKDTDCMTNNNTETRCNSILVSFYTHTHTHTKLQYTLIYYIKYWEKKNNKNLITLHLLFFYPMWFLLMRKHSVVSI